MRRGNVWPLAAAITAVAGLAVAGLAAGAKDSTKLTKITLQSKWVVQAQFAGYYVAKDKGFYRQAGLDVTIKPGGPDISPEQVVLGRQAEFGIDWLPSLLAQRDTGNNLVNIAQVYARSGTTEVTWRDAGITTFKKMRGKRFGVWIFGNEFEQRAALVKNGMNPDRDVRLVKQNFDMNAFLARQIDAASAMTYNELAQVLETKKPGTGRLYTMKDLRVFKYSKLGTGMLQDGVFVRGDWIRSKTNQATAVKFLQASFRGWIYCRDHFRECANIVLKNGPALPRGHQLWQMNEVNALVWPNRLGVGVMDPVEFRRTADIAYRFKVIKKRATRAAYRSDLARRAIANLKRQKVDVLGKKYKKSVVRLKEGGK